MSCTLTSHVYSLFSQGVSKHARADASRVACLSTRASYACTIRAFGYRASEAIHHLTRGSLECFILGAVEGKDLIVSRLASGRSDL